MCPPLVSNVCIIPRLQTRLTRVARVLKSAHRKPLHGKNSTRTANLSTAKTRPHTASAVPSVTSVTRMPPIFRRRPKTQSPHGFHSPRFCHCGRRLCCTTTQQQRARVRPCLRCYLRQSLRAKQDGPGGRADRRVPRSRDAHQQHHDHGCGGSKMHKSRNVSMLLTCHTAPGASRPHSHGTDDVECNGKCWAARTGGGKIK
jgi:hypothetical protein